MSKLKRLLGNLTTRFYDGPSVFNYPGRKMEGYRSPNVLIIQWLRAWSLTYMTTTGLYLLVLTGGMFLVSMSSLLMPVFLLAITMLSVFVVDFIAGLLIRPKVDIERRSPHAAPAGQTVRIDYRVTNLRDRPVWGLYMDTLPLPEGLKRPRGQLYVDHLEAHETRLAQNYVQTQRRGEYQLPLPLANSSFPFGLWRAGSRGRPDPPLIVYPDYTPLASLHLPVGSRFQTGLMMPGGTAGESTEFYGCREYRYGDNPRHIHAASWARLQKPIVKEFHEEYFCRTAVLLDTYTRPRHWIRRRLKPVNDQYEAALSLTAAIVDRLVRQDYVVDFYVPGRSPQHGVTGRGMGHLQTVLDVLACLDEKPDETFPGIPAELVLELREISAAVVVLLAWDDAREGMVAELQNAGIAVRTFVVDGKAQELPAAGDRLVQVDPAQVRAGEVREL